MNKAWTVIDVFQGQVNSLAAFNNKLLVGGQFQPTQNRSASLAMYDLANQNKMLTLGGPLGKSFFFFLFLLYILVMWC